MAKKNYRKADRLEEEEIGSVADMLTTMMVNNGISPMDMLQAIQLMQENGLTSIYKEIYKYPKPDYSKMAGPMHPDLETLVWAEGVDGITARISDVEALLKAGDADSAAKALTNAVYNILAEQKDLMEGSHTNLPLFGLLHLMVAMGVKDATPVILEILRQDGEFFDFFLSSFEEEMSYAISELCRDKLDELELFMYDTRLIPQTSYIVADAVIHMALTDPAMRPAVIAWLQRVLARFAEIDVYETSIDHIARSIAQLHAPELLPLVEHLYKVKFVPFIEFSSEKEMKSLLKKGTDDRRIAIDSIYDVLQTVEKAFIEGDDEDDEEDWEDDEDWDEEDNTSLLVDDNYDGMLYRLEISLDDSPVEVSREIIVPSNVRLCWLEKILVAAMGWNGSHLSQFEKGGEYYGLVSDDFDPWTEELLDYSEYALNDILNRKGSKIYWEYDFGDSWEHTIRLAEKIKDGGMPSFEVIAAVNACPPDDCGGVHGYAGMLEALKDKKHPEHDTWKEWVGPRFNPLKVSLKKLNSNVRSLVKHIL